MKIPRQLLTVWILIPVVSVVGCASQSSSKNSPTQVVQAAQEIPIEELLDVGITVFDPGIPEKGQPVPDDVFPELRKFCTSIYI